MGQEALWPFVIALRLEQGYGKPNGAVTAPTNDEPTRD